MRGAEARREFWRRSEADCAVVRPGGECSRDGRTRNEVMLSELAWIKDCQKKDTLLRKVGMAEGFCCRERRKPHMLDEHGLAKHPGTSMQRER